MERKDPAQVIIKLFMIIDIGDRRFMYFKCFFIIRLKGAEVNLFVEYY